MSHTGPCLCGAVTYEVDGPLRLCFNLASTFKAGKVSDWGKI